MIARSNVKSVQLEAVVIRADGTREDLGVVSYWHRNPLRRLLARARGIKGVIHRANHHRA